MLRADFINNFSHEFKTPIVSIAGLTRIINRGAVTEEEKREYMRIIEEESVRLADMATNVLNLTRVENQAILSEKSRFNVSEQIRSCLLLAESKWSKKEIDLELDLEEYSIRANEELLKQVWINLIDNAVKFSPIGGKITIKILNTGSRLRVEIANQSPPIPEDRINDIFKKFYQLDTSHHTDGNGIGLAIVKKIVDLHCGAVTVKSGYGVTTFTVVLPK
jgi:signal transduction histidine kinase